MFKMFIKIHLIKDPYQLPVGVDPAAVIQHAQGMEAYTQSVIGEARTEMTNTQRLADQAVQQVVHEARSHTVAAEGRAHEIVQDMQSRRHEEITRIQSIAKMKQMFKPNSS